MQHGYLQKRSRYMKRWKVRYFFLTSTHLCYSKRSGKKVKKQFDLKDFDIIDEGCKVHHDRHFVFAIVLRPKQEIYVSASTLDERRQWIEAIQQAQGETAVQQQLPLKPTLQPSSLFHVSFLRFNRERRAELKRQGAALKPQNKSIEYVWVHKVLPDWKNLVRCDVEYLCYIGIPKHLRGRAWSSMLGNSLQINVDLFKICKERATGVIMELDMKKTLLDIKHRTDDTDVPPPSQDALNLSGHLIAEPERNIRLLLVDMPRTFGHHAFFQPGAEGHRRLKDVLEAYTCYRPDLGYVQGMSYLAATLCFHMDSFSAFKALAALLGERLLFDMYRLEAHRTLHYVDVFDKLLELEIPQLAAHFNAIGMDGKMYMVDWCLTLFTRCLPLEVAYRIWDVYINIGTPFFFQVSMGILLLLEDTLLQQDLGQVMRILHLFPSTIETGEIFAATARVRSSRSDIRNMLDQRNQQLWSPVEAHSIPVEFPDNY